MKKGYPTCADLQLIDYGRLNKMAATSAFTGHENCFESNGHQNYVNWQKMKEAHPYMEPDGLKQ